MKGKNSKRKHAKAVAKGPPDSLVKPRGRGKGRGRGRGMPRGRGAHGEQQPLGRGRGRGRGKAKAKPLPPIDDEIVPNKAPPEPPEHPITNDDGEFYSPSPPIDSPVHNLPASPKPADAPQAQLSLDSQSGLLELGGLEAGAPATPVASVPGEENSAFVDQVGHQAQAPPTTQISDGGSSEPLSLDESAASEPEALVNSLVLEIERAAFDPPSEQARPATSLALADALAEPAMGSASAAPASTPPEPAMCSAEQIEHASSLAFLGDHEPAMGSTSQPAESLDAASEHAEPASLQAPAEPAMSSAAHPAESLNASPEPAMSSASEHAEPSLQAPAETAMSSAAQPAESLNASPEPAMGSASKHAEPVSLEATAEPAFVCANSPFGVAPAHPDFEPQALVAADQPEPCDGVAPAHPALEPQALVAADQPEPCDGVAPAHPALEPQEPVEAPIPRVAEPRPADPAAAAGVRRGRGPTVNTSPDILHQLSPPGCTIRLNCTLSKIGVVFFCSSSG